MLKALLADPLWWTSITPDSPEGFPISEENEEQARAKRSFIPELKAEIV
jgi:hypothetical protein